MSDAAEIIADYPRLLVENYCILASTALLWFDFALTFPTEVRRIWGRPFSGATLVYLFTRYTAIADRVLFVTEVLLWNSSDQACGRISRSDDILLALNYFAFGAFTCLRVYGVWGRDWKPLLVVVPLTLIKPVLLIYVNTHYIPRQGGVPYGCYYDWKISNSTIAEMSAITKASTIASDAILIALTWVKTFGIKRESSKIGMHAPLATLLLRDGTAYFIILLLIQLITIISSHIGSKITVWIVWPYFDQVLTVIFLSRFMLDLRGIQFSGREPGIPGAESTFSGPGRVSDIRFDTSRIVGNLGATLSYPDFASRSSVSSKPSRSPEHGGEIEEVERDGLGGGDEWPWYGDEKPVYADDPFKAGLLRQPPVVVDIIELQEPLSPLSPVSPSSCQGGSQASSSQVFSHV
ncbi:hypothetical protein V8D89_008393 [Ganoderma adspersum]